MASYLTGKLTKRLVESLGSGRHGGGNGLYLVVDPSGARRWIVRLTIKGKRNEKDGPHRTDLGLGGFPLVTLAMAREKALEHRRMAMHGQNPLYENADDVPAFSELAKLVHKERLPTWNNPPHGDQWINTLRDYTFPKIGKLPVSDIGQPEASACLSAIWTEKHETATTSPTH